MPYTPSTTFTFGGAGPDVTLNIDQPVRPDRTGYPPYPSSIGFSIPAGPYAPSTTFTFAQGSIGDVVAQLDQSVADTGDTVALLDQSVAESGDVVALLDQDVAVTGDMLVLLDQSVILAETGDVVTQLDQAVDAVGDVLAQLDQDVAVTGNTVSLLDQDVAVTGDVLALLAQDVAETGNVLALLDQTVTDFIGTGDMLAQLDQSVIITGDVLAAMDQTVTAAADVIALLAQDVAEAGDSGIVLAQDVAAVDDMLAALDQSVDYPSGDVVIRLDQSVGATGDVVVALAQNVYSIEAVAASWANWDCSVRVGGIEIDNLIDSVRIEAERNAARTAEFTVALSGTVDVLSWVGKAVQIDYVQAGGARWRRFTGMIVEPVFNMSDRTLRCTCSDDLQRAIDNYSNAALQALTGGSWSDHVFSKDNTGWDYLQDLLTTVPVSVEMDSNRVLRASSLNNKATPDYEFDALILDESLSVDLVRRSSLINRVNLSFEAGFTRLWQRNDRVSWRYPRTFCEHYWRAADMPTDSMVQAAIEAAGWTFINASYTRLWPTGSYRCAAREVYWTNNFQAAIRGFSANAAFRWDQNLTARYQISVRAPASITAYGELISEASASASFNSGEDNWSTSGAATGGIPSGFTAAGFGTYYRDEIDTDALNAALSAAVAKAANTIAASHRSNTVSFSLPLAPYLELHHTVQATDSVLTAKGIVNKITETYSFHEGEGSAVTAVELLLSSGQSGIDVIDAVYSAPQRPAAPVSVLESSFYSVTSMPTYVGGSADSVPLDDDWVGYITNLNPPDWDAPDAYPNELRIPFDAIPDDKRLNTTETITADIAIAVPHNLLTITV